MLSSGVFYTFLRPEICCGDAISSVRFQPSCSVLGPYQSRWLTAGRGLRPYLSNLGDKQTHCISNIWNTLEHRSESGNARDIVQPQTVLVICFPVKPVPSNERQKTHRESNSPRSDVRKVRWNSESHLQENGNASNWLDAVTQFPLHSRMVVWKMCFFSLCFCLSGF